ncbi:MAG: hypothetical protein KDM63_01330 [Verrucomicrobiae bacterium]|nr:hypothetical protein [Verrucomicrobiae bacterium]
MDINEGTLNPAGPALAQAPISGNFDATTNSTGAGIQSLGQTIAVPTGFTSAVLSWSDRIQNFSSGGFLDPSQEIRVRLLTATGEQIGELFSTNPGDAAIQLGPNARSADLTSLLQGYDGQSVVIQFENQNTANYQNLTLDDVSLLFVAPPQVTHSLLVETNGAGSTKFKGSVGNRSALSGLATNADGVTEIGGDVTIVDGAVAFGDAVILTSDLTVSTSGIGGTVTFADTVDAAPGSEAGQSVFTSGGGAVSLLGDAGTVRRLRSLAIDASGDVLTDGDIIALTDIGLSGADIAINGDLQAGIGDISVDASGSVTIGPDSSISGLAQPLDLLSQDFESFGQGSTVSGANVVLTEGWTNIINGSGDDLDWTPDKGGTPSRAGGTGPLVDHTLGTSLGTYLYVESSGTAAPAKVARLISPTFDLSNLSSGQAEFYYHLFGSAMGSLAVQASADGGVTWSGNLFTISGNQGDVWRQATVDLSDFLGSSDVRLRFEGTTGTSFLSDMAIDDLAITGLTRDDATDVTISAGSTVTIAGDIKGADIEIRAAGDVSVLASGSVTQASDLPDSPETDLLTQDFEGFGQKSTVSGATVTLVEGWINDSGDDLDWTSDLGGTPSRGGGTGPLTDHTLGTAAGTYLYVESSSSGVGFPNKVANLISPSIDLSGTVNNQVEFYHHLFGAAMGSLTVQVSTDGGATWSSDLYSVSGNQGDVWNKAQIDLSAFDGQSDVRLRLHAVTGTNFTSDIAVDDFRVFGDRILDELHIESETGSVTIAGEIAGDSEIHIEAAGDVQFTSSSIVSKVGPVTKGSPSTPSRIFGSTGTGLGANLYEIDPNTGARTLIGVTGMNHLGSLAYDPNTDTLYGVGNNSSNVSVLVTLDLTTGAATTIGAVGYSAGSGGLAFDPNTNTLYHISLITLRKINTATGAATIVGSGSISNMDGLAFDPNTNTLYASNSGTNSLYRINTSNGQPTLIGAYGVDVALTGLDFDSSTNTIYLSDFQTDRLYTVAPNTGAATPVGPAVTGFDIQGLAVIPGTPGTSLISTTPHIEVTSHGGGVTIEDGGQLLGGIGNVDLDATGDIALTGISTTGHVTARSTAGAILDGGDTRSDVDAATFTAEAVNGVGIDANALDTRIGNFEATGGTGGVFLGNTGNLVVGSIGSLIGVSTTNSDIGISATGTLSIAEAIQANGGSIDLVGDNASAPGAGVSILADIATSGTGTISITGTGGTGASDVGISHSFSGAEIQTVDGTITLTGFSANDDGVLVGLGTTIRTTGTGDITIAGTGGSSVGDNGVFMVGAGGLVTTVDGNIAIAGTVSGSDATLIAGGFAVRSTGTGDISISGTASGTPAGSTLSSGVAISSTGTEISASGGALSFTGSSIDDYGINIGLGTTISNTGAGSITMTGTGGVQSTADGISIAGLLLAEDGAIHLTGTSSGNDGVSVNGSSIFTVGVRTTGGDIVIDGVSGSPSVSSRGIATSGVGDIRSIDGDITLVGESVGGSGIQVGTSFAIRATGSGDIDITGTGGTNSGTAGVLVAGSSALVESLDGTINLRGRSARDEGVLISSGGQVNATGTGDIFISGTGAAFFGSNGVFVTSATSKVSTAGGSLSIDGQTQLDYAVLVNAGATVSTAGSGDLIVVGTGGTGSNSTGVSVQSAGSRFLTENGDISITGTSLGNEGVLLSGGGVIQSTGSGNVTVTGTSFATPSGSANGIGVLLTSSNSSIFAAGGDILVSGTAVQDGGVVLAVATSIANQAGGNITIRGTGGPGNGSGASSNGVLIQTNSTFVSTVDGNIVLEGISSGDTGVSLINGTSIRATGSGDISISGTGTLATGSTGLGVEILTNGSRVSTAGGDITIDGTSANTHGVLINDNASLAATQSGNISITGTGGTNSISDGAVVAASTSSVTVENGEIILSGSGGRYGAIASGSRLTSTGDGSISVFGTSSNLYGVFLTSGASLTTLGSGDIEIVGTGAGTSTTDGVVVTGTTTLVSTNDGDLLLSGTSGRYGAVVSGGRLITNGSGDIHVTGAGNISGVRVQLAGVVETTGTGGISLETLPAANGGIAIVNSGSRVTTQAGDISLSSASGSLVVETLIETTSGDITSSTSTVLMQSGSRIATAAGNIQLLAGGDITIHEISAGGDVTVSSASGTIHDRDASPDIAGASVTLNGTLAPGLSPGVTQISGNFVVADQSRLFFELFGPTPGNTDNDHDQIKVVNGTVTIGAGVDLDIKLGTNIPANGDSFILIDNDGTDAVVGTFLGLEEGSIITADAIVELGADSRRLFQISYKGGDGNDVVITSLGVIGTTDVEIDPGFGTLVITDVDDNNSDDRLLVYIDGGELVIRDNDNPLGTFITGAVQNSLHEIRIDLSLFSGDLVVNLEDGDDILKLGDLSGLPGGILVDGGGGFDRIEMLKSLTLAPGSSLTLIGEQFRAQNIQIAASGRGDISISAQDHDEAGTGEGYIGVNLNNVDISTEAGNIFIEGQSGGDGSVNEGIRFVGGSLGTHSGLIFVDGTGGTGAFANAGVVFYGGTNVSAGGDGSLTIFGTGGIGAGGAAGIVINQGTTISTVNGDLSLYGWGGSGAGNQNVGVWSYGATISSSGTGEVAISGTGDGTGQNNSGVILAETSISTNSGLLIVDGSGSSSGTSSNTGVELLVGTSLLSGSGGITIQGTGGGTGSYNTGVTIAGGSVIRAADSGDITITGNGSSNATGNYNEGVLMKGSQVTGSASGSVTLIGNGGAGRSYNYGIRMQSSSVTSGGSVNLWGQGGAGDGVQNVGVWIYVGTTITGGDGSTINGIGGSGSQRNHGVYMTADTTTNLDLASITGTAGTPGAPNSLDLAGSYFS